MYRSTQTAKEMVDELSGELDVWEGFSPEWYLGYINQVEQSLYANSLLFTAKKILNPVAARERMAWVNLSDAVENESPRAEDIVAVYADETRALTRMSADLAPLFPCTYYTEGEGESAKLCFRPARTARLTVYFRCRPVKKTLQNYDEEYIALPDEYTELLKEKLRGEAYLAAGEAGEAKNHLGAYNAYLSSFLLWAKENHHFVGGTGHEE